MFSLFKELKLITTPFFSRSLMVRGVVDIEITHACNLNCKSCHRLLDKSNFKYMPLEELDIVLEKFDHHIKFFSINGGEPTLHPEITEILKRSIEKLGGKRVMMATNGKNLGGIPEDLLRKMGVIFFSLYPGKNDEEFQIIKKKKSAGINIEIKQMSTFNDPSVLPDLSKISKSFFEFASSHCAKRQYRIVNGYVYGCVLTPLMERMHNIEGLGIPLQDFKPKMKIDCTEACKYCYVIAKYLNNHYNEIKPN